MIRSFSLRLPQLTALMLFLATAALAHGQGTNSEQIMRLGSPPNPPYFQPGTSTGPVIGKAWDPIMIPVAVMNYTVIVINPLPGAALNVPSPYGTQLCAFPPLPSLFVFGYAYQIYHIPIPNDPSLVGLRFCAQGIGEKMTGYPKYEFFNALDCKIGSV